MKSRMHPKIYTKHKLYKCVSRIHDDERSTIPWGTGLEAITLDTHMFPLRCPLRAQH